MNATEAKVVERVMKAIAANPAAAKAMSVLDDPYVVGGAVRDAAHGILPNDVDIVAVGVSGPALVEALSEHGEVELHGHDFPVYRFWIGGRSGAVEIALPRVERSIGDGHQAFKVDQAGEHVSLEEDLARRDFTVNAMAVSKNGRFVDLFEGLRDVQAGVIVGVTGRTIADDPLRTLRAFVLVSRYGWEIVGSTRKAIRDNAHRLSHMSAERLAWEVDKLMTGSRPAEAIEDMHRLGVLAYVFPEVDTAMGWDQNNAHHQLDLGYHLLAVLRHVCEQTTDVDVRLAALYHDVGKKVSGWRDPVTGSTHFYEAYVEDCVVGPVRIGRNHEDVSAEMIRYRFGEALRFSRERTERIAELAQHHMWKAFNSQRGARRFLARVGEHADDLLVIRWGDNGGKFLYPSDQTIDLRLEIELINRVREAEHATDRKMLAVNGNDLLAAGVVQGPEVGRLLERLLEVVLDDPSRNTRDDLLAVIQADERR